MVEVRLREPGVVAGQVVWGPLLAEAARRTGQEAPVVELLLADGARASAGDVLARLSGPDPRAARGRAHRPQPAGRACGVATATRAWVDVLAGTGVQVLDTRKTTPGLRAWEKYAVRCGGGVNKRVGLFDVAMVKDNHAAAAGSVVAAYRAVRSASPDVAVEVEVESTDVALDVVRAGGRFLMCDNMSTEDLARDRRRRPGPGHRARRAGRARARGGDGRAHPGPGARGGGHRRGLPVRRGAHPLLAAARRGPGLAGLTRASVGAGAGHPRDPAAQLVRGVEQAHLPAAVQPDEEVQPGALDGVHLVEVDHDAAEHHLLDLAHRLARAGGRPGRRGRRTAGRRPGSRPAGPRRRRTARAGVRDAVLVHGGSPSSAGPGGRRRPGPHVDPGVVAVCPTDVTWATGRRGAGAGDRQARRNRCASTCWATTTVPSAAASGRGLRRPGRARASRAGDRAT